MKIAILGAGTIAATVADTLRQVDDIECYAIASRDIEKAQDFAERFGFKKAYGSYEDMVKDGDAELVYIAVPHSHHAEYMKLCIEHGKNVLCEKSFTQNAAQAKEIVKLAKEKGVYLAEAMWTRYMPSRKQIDDVLASGVIGDIHMMTANLSYDIDRKPRILDPLLAGGALLDVGVYGINFALMHMGDDIKKIDSSVQMSTIGVDEQESITIHYADGRMAVLTHGVYSRSDRKGIFYGEKGYVIVENINNPNSIKIYNDEDKLLDEIVVPNQISGYEYQFLEASDCINEGRTESISMPLEESIHMMEIMDEIREDWGLVYPNEAD